MTDGTITVEGLTKRFGSITAVDDLSFTVTPGRVTGFLGPNGAGKTTTLRCLLGLVQASEGSTRFGDVVYERLDDPARTVGASLEATGFYPGRKARDHLRCITDAAGVPDRRVAEVLDQVGLSEDADRRVGEYSLGMRQRLSLAGALLGDPQYLILDEPANGLDPQGIAWLRGFLKYLASQGRTVLVSSHVLTEVQQSADDVVIVNHGRLVTAQPLSELQSAATASILVVAPEAARLAAAIRAEYPAATVAEEAGGLQIGGLSAPDVGGVAFRSGIELHGLREHGAGLEQLFLELTGGAE